MIAEAFSDKEFLDAAKNKDTKLFYEICKEKNYIKSFDGLAKNLNKKNLKNKLSGEPNTISKDGEYRQSIVFPVLVIAAIGVVVYVFTHDEVYFSSYVQASHLEEVILSENPVINIWSLKNGGENTHILLDSHIETQVDDIVTIVKERDPDYFKENSETEFRNIVKANLINLK